MFKEIHIELLKDYVAMLNKIEALIHFTLVESNYEVIITSI